MTVADGAPAVRRARRSHAPLGLAVLDSLAESPSGLGVTELSRIVGLEVAQTHRVIRELVTDGWIVQDGANGPYRLTGGLLGLAAKQLRHIELREVALPILRRLKQDTSETIILSQFRAGHLFCIARELSDAPVINWAQIGDSWQLGSAAAMSIAVETAVLDTKQLELLPPDYRPSPERIRELEECSRRGWSEDLARYRPRGCAVAAAILDYEARPVGAVAIAWPCDDSRPELPTTFGTVVASAAKEISAALGHLPSGRRPAWQIAVETREQDLFRHLADLRARTYEGAAGRDDQEEKFLRATRLLSPVVEEVLLHANRRLLLGSGDIERTEARTQADGLRVSWALTWPEQRAAVVRVTQQPLEPVAVVARLRPAHLHGHLGGSYFGDWPMQIVTSEDAQRQIPVVSAIVEAEFHQRVFEAGGNWRLIPAYCEQLGESTLIGGPTA